VEVLRIGDVIEAALKGFIDRGINLYLYDLSADENKRFLYYRPSRLSEMPEQPMAEEAIQKGLCWNETFDFAGRQWKMSMSPSSYYLKSQKMWQAWIVLLSSLVLTFTLAFYLFKKLRYTAEIERKVSQELRTNQQLAAEVSERRQAEAALRDSEARYRELFVSTPHPMWIYDLESLAFLDVNDAAMTHYGYSREEFLSMTIKDIRPAEDVPRLLDNVHHVGEGLDEAGVWRHIKKDGSIIEVEITSHALLLDQRRTELVLVNDITDRRRIEAERKQLQAQLLQAQKMESVGRLAGGVAHDFNNMLGVILGRAEMMFMGTKPEDPYYEDLQEIYKAAQRSTDLTRQLLAFARKQTIAPKVLYLNDTVEGMLKMLRRLIGEDIDLVWKPDTFLWPVKVDPAQVDQVLANLCVNARDAIFGIGKVIIETNNVFFDEAYCASHAEAKPGQYVMLAVSDDGCGMDKETRENLFEPFFTTKEVGEGTGLGLAMIYGIVKQNDGFINVTSEPGQGTTFKLYFPRTRDADKAVGEQTATAIETGSETILLVEDEASILRLGTAVLEKFGYNVIAACTPGEAISMAEQSDIRIHLLVTDVVMPEMNGKELKTRIEKLIPDIKVLFMSGYTGNLIVHQGILEGDVQFLQKPFSVSSLVGKVRKVLNQHN
jgi:two-component system sensor histidine kinase EvgS